MLKSKIGIPFEPSRRSGRFSAGAPTSALQLCFIGILTLAASCAVLAQRGGAQPARPDNPKSLGHLSAARKLAGDDAFLAKPYNFFCVAGNARAQNNNAPDLEPTKLFDNVYAVGNSETTVYALTSSEGILLLDAGFENKAEALAAQLRDAQSRSGSRQIHPARTRSCRPLRWRQVLSGHLRNEGGGDRRRLGPDQCACGRPVPGSRRRKRRRQAGKRRDARGRSARSCSAISRSRQWRFRDIPRARSRSSFP